MDAHNGSESRPRWHPQRVASHSRGTAMAAVAQLRGEDESFQGDKDALFEVIKTRSFRRGHFTLSSGKTSDLYFNLKSTMMDPQGSWLSAKVFLPVIRRLKPDFAGGL